MQPIDLSKMPSEAWHRLFAVFRREPMVASALADATMPDEALVLALANIIRRGHIIVWSDAEYREFRFSYPGDDRTFALQQVPEQRSVH
jgi:hypothetical protein